MIGGDCQKVDVVNVRELLLLGFWCRGDRRKVLIDREVVVEGNGWKGDSLVVELERLFWVNGLMERLGIRGWFDERWCERVKNKKLRL
ncbi:hypothetical protein, partial [Bacillus pumilus]|uniref:hypothetical protein n=1 Tax=Bacillus pumilus TaxID=1408 RepID=UPI001C92DD8A